MAAKKKQPKKPPAGLVEINDLSVGERQIIRMYMQGSTPRSIATVLRVEVKLVDAILDDPQIQNYIHTTRVMALDTFAQVKDEMTGALMDVAKRLRKTVNEGRDKDANVAAKIILTHHPDGQFVPRQKVDHHHDSEGNALITARSLELIEQRLDALDVDQYPVMKALEAKAVENEAISVT